MLAHSVAERFIKLTSLLALVAVVSQQSIANATEYYETNIVRTISQDYKNFYSEERLTRLGIAFGLAGIAANSNIDIYIRDWTQERVTSNTYTTPKNPETDDSLFTKTFGEINLMVPVSLLAASFNLLSPDTAIGNWGANTSRAYIVGMPAIWGMQAVTGGSRPNESPDGSAWHPFKDSNGVSGHSFVGAVPFLTIASMNPDNAWVRYPAYLLSAATGVSRITDDKHYASQVVLAWYTAWEAVHSVMDTQKQKHKLIVSPMVGIDGYGIIVSASW